MEVKFMKKIIWLLGMTLCLPTVSSCSSDDDGGDGDDDFNAEGTEISIPASVVDGVRVQGITADNSEQAVSVTYNADGTISSATTGGQEFVFEYNDTRSATATGRKLVKIYAKYYSFVDDDDHSEEWIAYNFKFNTDGFLVAYNEKISDKGEDYYENTLIKATLAYNAHNRIEHLSVSGYTNGWDSEEGKYSENDGTTTVYYEYTNGGALKKAWFRNRYSNSEEEGANMIYDYAGSAHDNTYNVVTPQLAAGMAVYSPILYILATTGYLGNASAKLPTKYTYESYGNYTNGDPSYHDTSIYNLSYTFWDNNRIKEIKSSQNGYPIRFTYSYLTK